MTDWRNVIQGALAKPTAYEPTVVPRVHVSPRVAYACTVVWPLCGENHRVPHIINRLHLDEPMGQPRG